MHRIFRGLECYFTILCCFIIKNVIFSFVSVKKKERSRGGKKVIDAIFIRIKLTDDETDPC